MQPPSLSTAPPPLYNYFIISAAVAFNSLSLGGWVGAVFVNFVCDCLFVTTCFSFFCLVSLCVCVCVCGGGGDRIQLPGRAAYGDPRHEHCSRHFNRLAAYEAHRQGFPVFYREEIERRILYKSEYWEGVRYLKPLLHLENPGPNIIGTALLSLVGCLLRNGSDFNTHFRGKDVL